MALREKVTEAMKAYAPKKVYDADHEFYYQDYRDNLFCALGDDARRAYEEGSGSETKPYIWKGHGKEVLCPPKMASIASSSAMTFNLLGNGPATILADKKLPAGNYCVQYEKKMQTLNIGSGPANLDAFLSNAASKTAVFCEMKLLEWLGEPGKLKDSYRKKECYVVPESFETFLKVITAIDKQQKTTPNLFKRYDVYQMFKHLLAIYNHTSFAAKDKIKGSMAGTYRTVILANIVNEFPAERIVNLRTRKNYEKALKEELAGANEFIAVIRGCGIPEMFARDCGVKLKVQYISAKEFADSVDMPQVKRDYLKRYFT
jgi:hypothetical protein